MSERKHVSDAAWQADWDYYGADESVTRDQWEARHRRTGTVQMTVAEVEAMEAQLAAKDAEVARLTKERADQVDAIVVMARKLGEQSDELERLRKGKDDGCKKGNQACQEGNTCLTQAVSVAYTGHALRRAAVPYPLDHRLGLPPADAEPCEPMSRRMPYRWGVLA